MAVGYRELPPLAAVEGIQLGIASAGVKYPGRRDLVVIALAKGSTVAATFTRNALCAAPVTVAKRHLQTATPAYLVINTGNANAATGEEGVRRALACCQAVAEAAAVPTATVLPYSTGVIGEQLPAEKIIAAIPAAIADLNAAHWADAAAAIMTTDTIAKGESQQFILQGRSVTITGIVKGSGMIHPNMATMLAYIATDVALPAALLQQALTAVVAKTFNRVTVDGDTSTNDAVTLIATGCSKVALDSLESADGQAFVAALTAVALRLAQLVIRDGEGATKFIEIEVSGALSSDEAAVVGFTIAHSPLVKTALFASDPNLGRIVAAVGRAPIADLQIEKVNIALGSVAFVANGAVAAGYREADGAREMAKEEIKIIVQMGRGDASATVWTTDFSYEYVKINAEYRS
ncbi:MAG: bifunctional glutamate N-acetyltransferase/amino-acid acetyltransferase ArgJ [Gammaproteobacteria bacterium]|nr:bifunctional glutamate N-acetyltransferase/amino-acid acetyltransferase ArgJ [Gammaproteobacteria bacterium]